MADQIARFSISNQLKTGHKDLIHDVSYSYNGRRMATCSSDQTIKVWDLVDEQWYLSASWNAHHSSIWRVAWGHPEFGQIIATCSFDKTVTLWEEIVVGGRDRKEGLSTWQKTLCFAECKASVTDVQFAPHYLGLILALCSADGCIYICEIPDITQLSVYHLASKIDTKVSCSCLSWNQSRITPPIIAVGSDDTSAGLSKVFVYKFLHEEPKRLVEVMNPITIPGPVRDVSFSPHMGRSFFQLAVAAQKVHIFRLFPKDKSTFDEGYAETFIIEEVAKLEDHKSQVWRVDWNITGTILASSGDDGQVRLWKASYTGEWESCAIIKNEEICNSMSD